MRAGDGARIELRGGKKKNPVLSTLKRGTN